jgi:hypothetical protein
MSVFPARHMGWESGFGLGDDALRSCTDHRQMAEVAIAVRPLNRILEIGRPESVRRVSRTGIESVRLSR